jgi:serine/threonine-protein kinase
MPDPREQLQAALGASYVLERELGRGGMATVYLAQDTKHGRPVALKVLHSELAASLGPERFRREITLAARLQHPHILSVHDSGETSAGQLWFTMPFVEGESLRDRLRREGQLPLEDALRIAREVAVALDYAHRHGVIHRDIKPENILLIDDQAMVADFGIACALTPASAGGALTDAGIAVGTPQYMSPEQASAERTLTGRTDVYSLGAVLYEMLTGEPPFTGATAQTIVAKMMAGEPPSVRRVRPSVPAAVDAVIQTALAPVPADRYATAGAFSKALEPSSLPVTGRAQATRGPGIARRRAALVGALLLVVAGIVFAARRLGLTRGAEVEGSPMASAAVLPFANMSPGKDQEYFSDGLTEELITALSQVPGLRVAARTSSFQFKGMSADVREIGRKLDVGTVLEGSVRRSGDRLRVTAQLVSAKNGYQLWSASYDRSLADVFTVQEDIARAIVSALRVRLGARADSSLAARPTRDLAAYDLYLQGRFAWNQRSEATLPQAVRYFEQATARDSGFARAYAGLADAYILLPSYASVSPALAWPKAKAAAERALALDSTLAEAYTSLAYGTMLNEWNWTRADALFKRAIAQDPAYANAHHWYADFLTGRGRLEEALLEMRRAAELDPLSRVIGSEVGWVLYTMHRDDEAIAQLERILRLDPNFGHSYMELGFAQIGKGRYQEAIISLQHALELGGKYAHVPAALAAAYAASGNRKAAIVVLHDLEQRSAHEYVTPFAFAIVCTALGRKTEAFRWLHKGIDERDIFLPENFNDPLLDPLRSDPRYPELVRRMGLGPNR